MPVIEGQTAGMKHLPIFLFLCLIAPNWLRADDWPNWLGPNTTGRSAETVPEKVDLTRRAWEAELGIGFSSVSVAGGRVYSMGHARGTETLWCYSENDGKLIWADSYDAALMPNLHEGGPGSTPAVNDGVVYAMSKDGQLRVYSAENGELIWKNNMMKLAGMRRAPEWGFTASPLIIGDQVLVEAGATFSFDRKTGDLIWQGEKYRPAYGTAQVFESGGRKYLASLKTDGLVIMDPANGKTLGFESWRTSFQTNATTPLLTKEGMLFLSTGYDRGCALFRFDGEKLSKLYENKNMSNHMGNSVLIDGYLYGFDGTAHRGRPVEFTCIDAANGEKIWHFEDLKYGSVIGAGKDLIVLTEAGELLIGAASPKGFEPRMRAVILPGRCWTPPVFANGKIYARNAAGKLVVVPIR